jgi:hypothetical protein
MNTLICPMTVLSNVCLHHMVGFRFLILMRRTIRHWIGNAQYRCGCWFVKQIVKSKIPSYLKDQAVPIISHATSIATKIFKYKYVVPMDYCGELYSQRALALVKTPLLRLTTIDFHLLRWPYSFCMYQVLQCLYYE